MQKALIFLVVLLVVLALVYWKPSKEGFTELMGVNWNSMNEGTPAALYTKLPINEPKTVTITEAGVGNIQPSPPPPSDLPTAPYEQRAKENPNPYRNPTNEPAKYIRLLGVKEDLQAFFGFQAGELETSSDPSVQIPLTRARADMGELIDVQSVMERNPGLPSRITVKQLDDIQSNLNYLRAVLNDLVNSGAIQMTAPLDSSSISQGFLNYSSIESFQTDPMEAKGDELQKAYMAIKKELMGKFGERLPNGIPNTPTIAEEYDDQINSLKSFLTNYNAFKNDPASVKGLINNLNTIHTSKVNDSIEFYNLSIPKITPLSYSDYTNSSSQSVLSSPPPSSSPSSQPSNALLDSQGPRATLKELQDFQIRIVVELKRLYATGTSDPVVQARINTLNRIKDDVDDVITKIEQNFYTPSTIPIFKSDIEKALPVLGKPTDPLPQILQKTNLPPAIASLFPGGLSPKDQEQAVQITNVMKGYMKNLFEGASWGFSFKYDNPNIAKLKAEAAKEDTSGGEPPLVSGLPGVKNGGARFSGAGVGLREPLQTQDISRELPTDSSFDDGLPGTTINRTLPTPESGSLDWKERSQQIKDQVRRRGMNPMDFGAMPEDAMVGPDFSWRGYTMMMCMRLNTTMDPGLAQSCGCPPQNWSGWKQ